MVDGALSEEESEFLRLSYRSRSIAVSGELIR